MTVSYDKRKKTVTLYYIHFISFDQQKQEFWGKTLCNIFMKNAYNPQKCRTEPFLRLKRILCIKGAKKNSKKACKMGADMILY